MDAALTIYRKQNPKTDNNIDIVSILHGTDLYPVEIVDYVHDYLDERCSNEPRSRWTNHGTWITSTIDEVVAILNSLYVKV